MAWRRIASGKEGLTMDGIVLGFMAAADVLPVLYFLAYICLAYFCGAACRERGHPLWQGIVVSILGTPLIGMLFAIALPVTSRCRKCGRSTVSPPACPFCEDPDDHGVRQKHLGRRAREAAKKEREIRQNLDAVARDRLRESATHCDRCGKELPVGAEDCPSCDE
jgi:hypothetical protein